MKVAVLGAGGVVGQNMVLTRPDTVTDAVFTRRARSFLYEPLDATEDPTPWLDQVRPDAIVNLVGENRVDVVEAAPGQHRAVNVTFAGAVARWANRHDVHLVHVSTQGVFSGDHPPYRPADDPHPITAYGQQKLDAEVLVRLSCPAATIARLTFVLGCRPFPGIGRENPLEPMFARPGTVQVNDRWFSPLWAEDAARILWDLAVGQRDDGLVVHVGEPIGVTRAQIAWRAIEDTLRVTLATVDGVPHSSFDGLAPRPADTTWAPGSRYLTPLTTGMTDRYITWSHTVNRTIERRALEIALALGDPHDEVLARLRAGFGRNHQAVSDDFAGVDVTDADQLLDWYRRTDSYVYELTAYHLDPGFNYQGMCEGVAAHLKAQGATRVAVIGDGIGDLTLTLLRANLDATYHDLAGSVTAAFAMAQLALNHGDALAPTLLSDGWDPPAGLTGFDAIVALDFFEHLVNVEQWAQAVYDGLNPGGLFHAQNAFAIGDAEHGNSIPMHLSINNRWEHDWRDLLLGIGFTDDGGNWWRKP